MKSSVVEGPKPGRLPMDGMRRMLRWFDRDRDVFAGEVELQGVPLAVLQRIVGAPADDPLVDCWPLPAERLAELTALTEVPVGLERFACFVEADAKPVAQDGGPESFLGLQNSPVPHGC